MPHIGFESIKTKVLDVDKNFSWARIMYFKDADSLISFRNVWTIVDRR